MLDAVNIRVDAEISHALAVLTRGGATRSAEIRRAIIEAGMRAESAAAAKRAILRDDLGEADGLDVGQLLAARREDER